MLDQQLHLGAAEALIDVQNGREVHAPRLAVDDGKGELDVE